METDAQVVFLDALGTLIELEPVAPRLAAELGIPADERVGQAVAAEIHFYRRHMAEGRDPASLADLRQRCAAVLSAELGIEVTVEAMLRALSFRAYPEVPAALAALREQGLKLVVVSNWDSGLDEVLERCGLAPFLDGIVTSAVAGSSKPEPGIFGEAMALAGCGPEAALHVGDTLDADIRGAEAIGIDAVLVDRGVSETEAGVPRIATLDALPRVIEARNRDRRNWRSDFTSAPAFAPIPGTGYGGGGGQPSSSGMRAVDHVVDPRHAGWGIGRTLLGLLGGLSALIVLSAVLFGIVAAFDPDFDVDSALDSPGLLIAMQGIQAAVMVAAPLFFVWPGGIGDRLYKLGLRHTNLARKGLIPWRAIGLVSLAMLVYFAIAIVFNQIFDPQQEDLARDLGIDDGVAGAIAAGVAIIVLAPLAEEILFRGFVLRGLWNSTAFWPAALISSAAWAALHLGDGNWAVVGQLTLFGLVLAWTVRRTGGSIWPAIWLHAVNNTLAFIALLSA